jgi:hypothetical protein
MVSQVLEVVNEWHPPSDVPPEPVPTELPPEVPEETPLPEAPQEEPPGPDETPPPTLPEEWQSGRRVSLRVLAQRRQCQGQSLGTFPGPSMIPCVISYSDNSSPSPGWLAVPATR